MTATSQAVALERCPLCQLLYRVNARASRNRTEHRLDILLLVQRVPQGGLRELATACDHQLFAYTKLFLWVNLEDLTPLRGGSARPHAPPAPQYRDMKARQNPTRRPAPHRPANPKPLCGVSQAVISAHTLGPALLSTYRTAA